MHVCTKHCKGPQGKTTEEHKGNSEQMGLGLALGLVLWLWFAYYPCELCSYNVPL